MKIIGIYLFQNWKKNFPLRKKKRKLPKAIIVVHLAGLPVDPIQLKKLSKKYKFKIIEDAAHSIGSKYYNKKVEAVNGQIFVFLVFIQ